MQPLVEEYPELERGSWDLPVFYELLRRGIAWVFSNLKSPVFRGRAMLR